MPDDYRYDQRTQEEFTQDIKDCTAIEAQIIKRWASKNKISSSKVKSHGCDNSGSYLESNEVNSKSDYKVKGHGLIEVKFSKPKLKSYFHLKVSQIESYIRQKAKILFVNGWGTKSPEYTIITQGILSNITNDCNIVNWQGFGLKTSYRIPINWFKWRPL